MAQIVHQASRTGTASGTTASAPAGLRPVQQMDPSRLPAYAMGAVAIVTAAAALAAILAPGIRPLLLQEDGIIEMASVVCLATVVIGAAAALSLWGLRAPLALAGLIGFAELMDETSFGSRLFGFQPPALYGGGQLDGFHDLLILAYRLLRNVSQDLAWLWIGLMLAVSVGLMLFALRQMANGLAGTASRLAGHILLLLHVGFIGLAQVIDIATSSHILSAMEEVFELDAALLLVFYVAQQAYNSWSASAGRLPA